MIDHKGPDRSVHSPIFVHFPCRQDIAHRRPEPVSGGSIPKDEDQSEEYHLQRSHGTAPLSRRTSSSQHQIRF